MNLKKFLSGALALGIFTFCFSCVRTKAIGGGDDRIRSTFIFSDFNQAQAFAAHINLRGLEINGHMVRATASVLSMGLQNFMVYVFRGTYY
jgi:hypothetical protein